MAVSDYLRKYERGREQPLRGFETEALQLLEASPWPGNVRELQNVIERACALAEGDTITARDLPEHLRSPQPVSHTSVPTPTTTLPLKEAKARWMSELEAAYLTDLLKRHSGNVSQAARAAGIDRKTFHRLLNKYRLR